MNGQPNIENEATVGAALPANRLTINTMFASKLARTVPAGTHQKMRCVAAQRLAGYANNANPPYIYSYGASST
jgi:hypothetical protein